MLGELTKKAAGIRLREDACKMDAYFHYTPIPKLISGELRIPDAEKFFEEVGG